MGQNRFSDFYAHFVLWALAVMSSLLEVRSLSLLLIKLNYVVDLSFSDRIILLLMCCFMSVFLVFVFAIIF